MKALKQLKENTDLVLMKADRGGEIVIMDSSHYISKTDGLLADEGTYSKQKQDKGK